MSRSLQKFRDDAFSFLGVCLQGMLQDINKRTIPRQKDGIRTIGIVVLAPCGQIEADQSLTRTGNSRYKADLAPPPA